MSKKKDPAQQIRDNPEKLKRQIIRKKNPAPLEDVARRMPLIHDPNQKADPSASKLMPLVHDPNQKAVDPNAVQMMDDKPIHPSNNPAFGNFSTRENGNFKARTIDWDKVPMGGGNATVNGKTLTVGEAMRSGMVQDPRWYFSGHPQSNDLMMGATIDGATPPEFIEPTDIPDEYFKPNANTDSDTGSTTIPNRPPPKYGFDFFGPIPEFSDAANTIPLTDDEKWSAYEYNKEMRRIEGVNFGSEESRKKREVEKIKAKIKEKFGPDGLNPDAIRSGLEQSNMAQQEPARQDSALRQDERDLAEDEARTQRAELAVDFEREMNPNQGQEDLDDLGRTVRDERRSEIFEPSHLTAAGRSEFDAAARGEIPGYAIKDPAARAAFSKAREYDIGFGSKERQRSDAIHSPDGPDHPFDQNLMDDLQGEGNQLREEAKSRGVSPTEDARIRTYEEAKKNGRLSLFHGDDIQRFEEALKRRDAGESDYARGIKGNHEGTDKSEGGFDYEAMGERAQKGQQPRSAGGVGDGPLSAEGPGQGKINRHFGDDPHARASHGKYSDARRQNQGQEYRTGGLRTAEGSRMDGYRVQNAPRGSGRYAAVMAGSAGGGGRGVAYPERPLPASQRDPNSSEGGAYSLPDGGMMPNPDGMSESDFNDAVFNNPVPMEEAFQYAMENGQMTKAEQEELQQLQIQGYPASVSPHQREAYDANRKAKLGRLAGSVFRKNIRHAEVQRSKDAREDKSVAAENRRDMKELESIYRRYLDDDTKNKVDTFGNLMAPFANDTKLIKKITTPLTKDQFNEARKWRDDRDANFAASQEKNAGAIASIEKGEAPAPSDEAHWKFISDDIGFGEQVHGAQSTPTGESYGVMVEDDQVFLRMPQDEWDNVKEKDRMAVAGIILPPEGTSKENWMNKGLQVAPGTGGEKIMTNSDGTLAIEEMADGNVSSEPIEQTVDPNSNTSDFPDPFSE